jgi:hypothetical protein
VKREEGEGRELTISWGRRKYTSNLKVLESSICHIITQYMRLAIIIEDIIQSIVYRNIE